MSDEGPQAARGVLFQQKLLDNMHDAVVFVDRELQDLAVESRGRAADGHRGGGRPPAVLAAAAGRLARRAGRPVGRRRLPGALRDPDQRAIAAAIHDPRAQNRPVAVDMHTVPVIERRRHDARGHAAAARRLAGGFAGTALPEPARTGDEGSADASGQPGRVRSARTRCSSPPTWSAGCRAA